MERAQHMAARAPERLRGENGLRLGQHSNSAAKLLTAALETEATGEGIVAQRWRAWRGGAPASERDADELQAVGAGAIDEMMLDGLIEHIAAGARAAPILRSRLEAMEKRLRATPDAPQQRAQPFSRTPSNSDAVRQGQKPRASGSSLAQPAADAPSLRKPFSGSRV